MEITNFLSPERGRMKYNKKKNLFGEKAKKDDIIRQKGIFAHKEQKEWAQRTGG